MKAICRPLAVYLFPSTLLYLSSAIAVVAGPGVKVFIQPPVSAQNAITKNSFIVSVFIVTKVVRGITSQEVFSTNFQGRTFISELSPAVTYNLLRKSKARARRMSYRLV